MKMRGVPVMSFVFAAIFLTQVLCFLLLLKNSDSSAAINIVMGIPFFALMILLAITPLFTGNKNAFIYATNSINLDHVFAVLSAFLVYLVANIFAYIAADGASFALKVTNLALLLAVFFSGAVLVFSIT